MNDECLKTENSRLKSHNAMTLLAEFDVSSITLFLGLAIITAVMLRLTYRRLGRRTKNGPLIEKAPRHAPYGKAGGAIPPSEKGRWEGEMCEIARETSARLDSKMMALAELIRQADEAAARLEAANRAAEDRSENHK